MKRKTALRKLHSALSKSKKGMKRSGRGHESRSALQPPGLVASSTTPEKYNTALPIRALRSDTNASWIAETELCPLLPGMP